MDSPKRCGLRSLLRIRFSATKREKERVRGIDEKTMKKNRDRETYILHFVKRQKPCHQTDEECGNVVAILSCKRKYLLEKFFSASFYFIISILFYLQQPWG